MGLICAAISALLTPPEPEVVEVESVDIDTSVDPTDKEMADWYQQYGHACQYNITPSVKR